MARSRGTHRWRRLVRGQLRLLFELAQGWVRRDGEVARRYVEMARQIVRRTRVRLPREVRHQFCHRCGQLFRPGITNRVRLRRVGRQHSLVITCLECGYRRKLVWRQTTETTQAGASRLARRGKRRK